MGKYNTKQQTLISRFLEKNANCFSLTLLQICDTLYEIADKDIIYFGLLASECNKTTQKLGGLKYAN